MEISRSVGCQRLDSLITEMKEVTESETGVYKAYLIQVINKLLKIRESIGVYTMNVKFGKIVELSESELWTG